MNELSQLRQERIRACSYGRYCRRLGAVLWSEDRGRPATRTCAALNPSGRFEDQRRELVDDGWQTLEDLGALQDESSNRETAHGHYPE